MIPEFSILTVLLIGLVVESDRIVLGIARLFGCDGLCRKCRSLRLCTS